MTLDDYDLMEPTTAATGTGATKRCRRHEWERWIGTDHYTGEVFERFECRRCGAFRNDDVVKRNRRNRLNGGANERRIAKRHGGRKTGPLGGRDDVMVGSMFAVQAKRTQRFSVGKGKDGARTYLADLARTFPDRIPYVTHHLPYERDGIVVLRESDWLALHGPDGTEDAA